MCDVKETRRARCLMLAAAILGLITALLLPGCRRPTPTPQPASISFACLDEELGYYEAQARAFSASHSTVTVRILPRRQAALAALTPDEADTLVVSLPLGPQLERGDLLSLDGWLAEKDDLYAPALQAFSREGKVWALPLGIDPVVMYYNKGLFDQRNVAYPKAGWTWDVFLQAAQQLRNQYGGIYGYAAGLWPEEPWLFILQHGGRLADDWLKPSRLTFDNAEALEALQWYADLIFRYDVSANLLEARDAFGERGIYGGVGAGKVAMWAGYYSARPAPGDGQLNWGVAVLPRERTQATLARVEGVAISAKAAHPELCWQWLDFLSRQVPAHLAPARRSVANGEAFAKTAGADLAAAVRSSLEYAFVPPQDPAPFYIKLNQVWAEAFGDIVTGRLDPELALQKAQRATK